MGLQGLRGLPSGPGATPPAVAHPLSTHQFSGRECAITSAKQHLVGTPSQAGTEGANWRARPTQSATRSLYFAIRHGGMSGFWRTYR